MIRLGLYLALAGSALACAPWLNDAFGMVKVLVALAGVAIAWLATTPRRTPLDAPIAACLLALAASTAVSVSPQLSITGFQSQPFYGLLAIAAAVLIFYAAQAWPEGPAMCCAAVAIATGVACALQFARLGLPPFQLVMDPRGARAVGTIGNPAFLGAVMAVALPGCLALGGIWGRVGAACAALAIAASGSRGPAIAAAVGSAAYLGLLTPRRALYGSLAAAAVLLAHMNQSDALRYEIWGLALRGGIERPWLGWGPDTFFVVNALLRDPASQNFQASAHNDMLQAWVTTGAVGLAAYAALWWAAWRACRASPAALGALAALFVAAKFNPVPPPALYLAAALVGAAVPAGRPARWIWGAGLAVLLVAPGLAARAYLQDGAGGVQVKVKR